MTDAEKIAAYEAYYMNRFKAAVDVAASQLAVAKDRLRVASNQQARGETITGVRPK